MNRSTRRTAAKDAPSPNIASRGRWGLAALLVAVGVFGWSTRKDTEDAASARGPSSVAAPRSIARNATHPPSPDTPSTEAELAAPESSRASSAHPDLGSVIEQVHFAFRRDGRAHVGRHSTYAIEARAGSVKLTPYRYPTADGAEAAAADAIEGKSLVLETSDVSRGGRSVLSRRPLQDVGAHGRLEIDRGDVIETWTNGALGAEQAWRVSSKPDGRGDLVFAVSASGLDYVGSSDTGIHFADETRLGFRYGHATWVDANGARVAVDASYEDGRIVMRVPAAVVDGAAYPAVLDPIVGTEFGMDVPQTGPTAFDQSAASVAFDGTNYLLVWQDFRSGTSYDIYATRVTQAGAVLDGGGLVINASANSQRKPVVGFDGTNYLVVWEDARSGASDIYGTRVSADGAVLDGAGIQINTSTGTQQAPALAFDGTRFLVVWQDGRSGSSDDVYATRVSTAGAVLDGTGIAVSAGAQVEQAPAVAFGTTTFLVVWSDGRGTDDDIYAARVSTAGAVTDTAGLVIDASASDQTAPAIAFDGTNYLVVWESLGGTGDVYASRVSVAGVPVDATAFSISSGAGAQSAPAVAFDGTTYLVLWQDNRSTTSWDIYGTRVDTAGALLDGATGWAIADASTDETAPNVAANGTGLGMVAYDGPFAPAGGVVRTMARRYCAAGVSLVDTTCDGFDDDCDGLVDEEYVVGATSCGQGACYATGSLSCVAGVEIDSCVAGTPAATDADCDDVDDDCSGQADEDYVAPATTCGVGGCARTGFGFCVAGVVSDTCVPGTPAANDLFCDNFDDDCDGLVDEDYVAPTTNCGAGACASTGTAACVAGVITDTCVAGTPPSTTDTTCNGVDDDCNNAIDDGFVPVSTTCGFGVCAATGTAYCINGAVADNCAPYAPPSTTDATCDNFDDDCSGVADEDYPATPTVCGVGACARAGANTCVAGALTDTCVAGTPAASDATCDGIDDDCNGQVDEDFVAVATSCGVGACGRMGTTSCVGGVTQDSCTPGAPAASDATCNGIDNDCNGQVDEDYPVVATTCGVGACASTGTRSCMGGSVVDSCVAGTAAANDAVCNGVDDDCSGQVDEDYVSTSTNCGVGACARTGVTSCVSGAVQNSCAAGSPTGPETDCDAVDDDCDGTADEDFPSTATTCGVGVCAATGSTSCVNGAVQNSCVAGTAGSSDGDCDGFDDDCDGMVDEDASCPIDGGVDGSTSDGSVTDAGSDGSVVSPVNDGGCACGVAGGTNREPTAGFLASLVALVAMARRRRRASR